MNYIQSVKSIQELTAYVLRASAFSLPHASYSAPIALREAVLEWFDSIMYTTDIINNHIKSIALEVSEYGGTDRLLITFRFIYDLSTAEMNLCRFRVNREIDDVILPMLIPYSEAWEKAYAALCYCARNWEYQDTGQVAHTAYGAVVNHRAVCQGFALGYCAIMTRLHIPCMNIYGEMDGEAHAWNAIRCWGGWFFVDVTLAVSDRQGLSGWNITMDGRSINDRSNRPPDIDCRITKWSVLRHFHTLTPMEIHN